MNIILASSSAGRKKQLTSLGLEFSTVHPNIDETPQPNEKAEQLVLRLSQQKAAKVAEQCNDAIIIAGDQVCICQGKIAGKPYSAENAIKQLKNSSGKTLRFYSGVCVLNTQTNHCLTKMVPTDVTFKHLELEQIRSYVTKAQPIHCAGSFNVEGLGIALFEKIVSNDPTALIGLPLITVVNFLQQNQIVLP